MAQKFKVIVKNIILGNSERVMTIEEIKKFNVVALSLAEKVQNNPDKAFTSGMWTVRAA